MNPEANPTYTISGLEIFKGNSGDFGSNEIANSSNVTASINAGLNGTNINANTIHVWVKDLTQNGSSPYDMNAADEFKRNLMKALEIYRPKRNPSSAVYDEAYTNDDFKEDVKKYLGGNVWCVKDNTGDNSSSASLLTLPIQMNEGAGSFIKVNHYYIIAVTGYDKDGLEFNQDNYYGFKGTGTGRLPSIKVTEPSNLSTVKSSAKKEGNNGGLTFVGIATNGDQDVATIDVTVNVKDESENKDIGNFTKKLTTENGGGITKNGDQWKWSFSPSETEKYIPCPEGKEYLYTVDFKVTDKGNSESSATCIVHVDAKKPNATITSITPVISDYGTDDDKGKSFVNGKITVKGNVEETNLKKVKIEFYDGEELIEEKDFGKVYTFTHEFDTKKIVDNTDSGGRKNLVVKVIAEDSVGNVGVTTAVNYNEENLKRPAGECIIVDQVSDRPKIITSNFEKINDSSEIKSGTNLFGIESNNKMKFSVEDDDGTVPVDNIKAFVDDEKSQNLYKDGFVWLNGVSEGEHKIIIQAKDSVWKTDKDKNNFIEENYLIMVTAGAPKIEIEDSSIAYKNGDVVQVKGKLTNSSNSKVTVTLKGAGKEKEIEIGPKSAKEFTDEINVTSEQEKENKQVAYSLVDKYGQSSSASFTYVVDNKKPEINITGITPKIKNEIENAPYFVNGNVLVTFNARDNYDLDKVEYECYESALENEISFDESIGTVTGGTKKTDEGLSGEFGPADEGRFGTNVQIDTKKISGNEEKKNLLILFKATDKAGNVSYKAEKFIVDQATDRPKITPSNFRILENGAKDIQNGNGGNLFGVENNNNLMGSAEDDDGISSLTVYWRKAVSYSADGNATFSGDYSSATLVSGGISTSVNLSMELPKEEGKYEIYFEAKDTVYEDDASTPFNVLRTESYYVGVSKGSPTISLESIDNRGFTRSYKNGNVIINVKGKSSNYDRTTTNLIRSIVRTFGSDIRDATVDGVEKTDGADYSFKANESGEGTFTATIRPLTLDSGKSASIEYTVTDVFGQTSKAAISYVIDDNRPELVTEESKAGYGLKIQNALYSQDKWYKNKDVSIEGHYHDEGSGISEMRFVLIPEGKTESDAISGTIVATSDSKAGAGYYKFKGTISGVEPGAGNILKISALDSCGNDSGEISYTLKMDETAPNYEAKFVSIDGGKIGNSAAGTVTVNGKQNVSIYGKISDAQSGVGTLASGKVIVCKVGGKELVCDVGFTASDDGLENWDAASKAEYRAYEEFDDKTKITGWKIEILAKNLMQGGNLSAECTDIAGNKFQNPSVLSFTIDDQAPQVTIRTSATGVNGSSESIEGSVTENYSLDGMDFYYSTGSLPENKANEIYDDSSKNLEDYGWTRITKDTIRDVASIYSWKIDGFDFNRLSGAENDAEGKGKVYILPAVKDKAGNTSAYKKTKSGSYEWNATEFNVDMNRDRPKIQVGNLDRRGSGTEAEPWTYILKYGKDAQITGTVSDDDATSDSAVKILIGSSRQITAVSSSAGKITATFIDGETADFERSENGSTTTWKNSLYGTTVLSGSDWSYTPADTADGIKSVYFYIEDNRNGIFYTGNATKKNLYKPYFQYKTEAQENSSSALSYGSDSNSPEVSSASIISYEDAAGTNHVSEDSIGTSLIEGGVKRRFISFKIKAFDANGIDGFTIEAKEVSSKKAAPHVIKYYAGNVPSDAKKEYSQNGSVAVDSVDVRNSIWTTGVIDLGGKTEDEKWTTGEISVTVNVYDKSGLKGNGSYSFNVDNSAPEIKNISPASGEEKTGTFSVSGDASDMSTGRAGLESLTYYIPTKVNASKSDAELAVLTDAEGKSVWQDKSILLDKWAFSFNGEGKANDCPLFSTYAVDEYSVADENSIWTVPVYIKAVDKLGNFVIERHSVKYNPDGDKPRTDFTYPTNEQYHKDDKGNSLGYVTLGSTIRVTGTVTIPNIDSRAVVDGVYIQIAQEKVDANGKHVEDWQNAMTTCQNYGYQIVTADTISTVNSEKVNIAEWSTNASGFSTEANRSSWWGIPAQNTSSSWVIAINQRGELDPKKDGVTNNIAIRACSVNNKGKAGSWSTPYYIHVDNSAPVMTVKLRQYDKDPSVENAKITAEKDYVPGMYLKDDWYIYLEITDESGIVSGDTGIVVADGKTFKKKMFTVNEKECYKVWIPVTGTEGNLLTYKVSATDTDTGNPHTVTNTYQVYIDNTAPEFGKVTTTTSGENSFVPEGRTRQMSDYKIKDSNRSFNIASDVAESGSGFARTVFYLIRKKTGASYTIKSDSRQSIFDPFSLDSSKNPADTKIETSDLEEIKITQGDSEYSLWGKKIEGSQKGKKNRFYVNVSSNSHIRKGGLIYIGNLLRRIENITSTYVEFDEATDGNATSATFIYAQVVDNQTPEDGSASVDNFGFTFKGNDDGDGMPEKVDLTSNGVKWNADIRSSNIADGPITLVMMAFDKAGNVSCMEIDTSVANNAPRIAKVFIGTDIDGDSKYQKNEFVEYNWSINEYNQKMTSGYTDAMALKTSDYVNGKKSEGNGNSFIIKNGLAVVPEIVGGNLESGGSIGIVYSRTAEGSSVNENGAVTIKPVTGTPANPAAKEKYTLPDTAELTENSNKFYGYVISNEEISGVKDLSSADESNVDGENKKMSFTFWDETEEGVKGTSTQNAVLFVEDFTVDLIDGQKPVAKIHPFHWNSKADNSIQKDSNGNLLGHIELEEDIKGSELATTYGNDPKVSGKIMLTGYAYDETRLSKIEITGTEGKFNPSGCYVTYEERGSSGVAWNSNENTTEGWKLSVTEKRAPDQQGHLVEWKLELDTEKFNPVACTDLVITVTATDASIKAGHNSSESGSGMTERTAVYATDVQAANGRFYESVGDAAAGKATGTNSVITDIATCFEKAGADATHAGVSAYYTGTSGKYQMDVVPYVTGVITSLSSLSKKIPSMYDRTALGHYPVRYVAKTKDGSTAAAGETVTFTGFNLGVNTSLDISTLTTEDDSTTGGKSAKYVPTVNGIPAINNMNNNDAKGSFAGTIGDSSSYSDKVNYAYNRKPNNANNNLLTDDIVFDVWEFNSAAAVPISGKIEQPVMKINPKTGKIGFAFVNGPLYFSMGGKVADAEDYSYNYWVGSYDFFTSVGFHYDDDGNSWAVAAGGDINSTAADKFILMSDKWGVGGRGQEGSYSATNARRLESIGMKGTKADLSSTTVNFDKQRIKSPSFASSVHGEETNLYLAYYDAMNDEIRFKAGNMATTNQDKNQANDFIDYDIQKAPYSYRNGTVSIVAGDGTSYGAGEYVSIAAIPGSSASADTVVMAWYDANSRTLYYSYNTSPLTNRAGTSDRSGWSNPVAVFSGKDYDNAGEYCKIAIDKNGGVHIAAYDPVNLDLVYAYSASATSPSFKTAVVDSNGVVGSNLTLDVALVGSNPVPYIGYYATSCIKPKYARLVSSITGTDIDGSKDDELTGKWEISVVPSANVVEMQSNQHNDINIGVWKKAGVLESSTTGTSTTSNNPNSYSSTSFGQVYGNGTKNAVLGYAIKNGSIGDTIETAQMR